MCIVLQYHHDKGDAALSRCIPQTTGELCALMFDRILMLPLPQQPLCCCRIWQNGGSFHSACCLIMINSGEKQTFTASSKSKFLFYET